MENNTPERLEKQRWTHPDYYAGHSPEGDFAIYGQHRDSDLLTTCNYACILEQLTERAEEIDPEQEWVYDFRASHWAFGWVETIIVKQSAPEEVLNLAAEILEGLDDYPCVDDVRFSEAEYNATCEFWNSLSDEEKIETIEELGLDTPEDLSYLPQDDQGALRDRACGY